MQKTVDCNLLAANEFETFLWLPLFDLLINECFIGIELNESNESNTEMHCELYCGAIFA